MPGINPLDHVNDVFCNILRVIANPFNRLHGVAMALVVLFAAVPLLAEPYAFAEPFAFAVLLAFAKLFVFAQLFGRFESVSPVSALPQAVSASSAIFLLVISNPRSSLIVCVQCAPN